MSRGGPHDLPGPPRVSGEEYQALAEFRYALRRFLHFSEEAARSVAAGAAQVAAAAAARAAAPWAAAARAAVALLGVAAAVIAAGCGFALPASSVAAGEAIDWHAEPLQGETERVQFVLPTR